MKFGCLQLRRTKGLFFVLLGAFILLAVPRVLHAASDFTYDANVTYQVQSTGSTRVLEEYTITGTSDNRYLDAITLSTPVNDAGNITAAYTDGTPIPYTESLKTSTDQGYNYTYKEIVLKFPRKIVGRTPWDFHLSYNTDKLVDTKGAAHTFYVPAIAQTGQQSGSYVTYVSVPKDFGLPHSSGAVPTDEGTTAGRTTYSFTQQDLAKQAVALTFGNQTVYSVNFNFPLRNDAATARTMTVTLPPDTSSQKIYVNSLDPKPKATRLDIDGNVLADYVVPARTTVTVKTDISAVIRYLDYDLAASGVKADIPADLAKRYTGATHYWQSLDPNIIIKAKQATADTTKVADQVGAIQKVVVDTLTYNDAKIKYNIRQGATKALQNPTNAVCLEYSDLMIALLRAQGIPARMPVGYAYTGGLKASKAVSDSLHSWVEAYIPNVGWVNVDPTWGEKYDNFGKSDLDHFAFAIWGANDSLPAPVMVGTSDTGYQYEQTKISFIGAAPKPKLSGWVRATRWVLLPFVSLVKYEVSGPDGVAGDNYELKLSGAVNQKVDLGSLAPSQDLGGYIPVIGANYLHNLDFNFHQTAAAGSISKTSAQTNYLPVIILMTLVFVVVAGLLLKWVLKRRKRNAARKLVETGRQVANTPEANKPERSTDEVLKSISARTKKIKDESNNPSE